MAKQGPMSMWNHCKSPTLRGRKDQVVPSLHLHYTPCDRKPCDLVALILHCVSSLIGCAQILLGRHWDLALYSLCLHGPGRPMVGLHSRSQSAEWSCSLSSPKFRVRSCEVAIIWPDDMPTTKKTKITRRFHPMWINPTVPNKRRSFPYEGVTPN